MPHHSDAEKARIRNLTQAYLPSSIQQRNALRDCPSFSLHHSQASYGRNTFATIGVIYEVCRAGDPCRFHGKPLGLQMTKESRVRLLSELEALDPPPYHDPANYNICRSIRDQILITGNVTAPSQPELQPAVTDHDADREGASAGDRQDARPTLIIWETQQNRSAVIHTCSDVTVYIRQRIQADQVQVDQLAAHLREAMDLGNMPSQ